VATHVQDAVVAAREMANVFVMTPVVSMQTVVRTELTSASNKVHVQTQKTLQLGFKHRLLQSTILLKFLPLKAAEKMLPLRI
jgi:hypothetical protein